MKHPLLLSAALVLSIGFVSGCHRQGSTSVTTIVGPSSCTVALAPRREKNDRDREIARAQSEARGGAHEKQALERLGYLYVSRARVSNDPGDYKLAEAAADCLDSRYPGEAAALLLRGHVLHQLHRFREAEQIARAVVVKRDFVLDYGLLGDVLMEQGRLTEAAKAYQKMIDLKPFYQSYVRAAHLRWLKGDLDGAIELMWLAIQSASPRDPESSAWAWTRLALFELQAGRLRAAARAAESALTHQPDYAAALLAHGRIFLAMDRPSDALEVLRRAARLNPLPEYQWVLADALRLQGHRGEAEIVERDLMTRGAGADSRTLALFLATRHVESPKAIALAEEELRARADVFTLDAHAWALAANGRLGEARDVMKRALAEGTQDGRLFLHAGVIAAVAGRDREARRWLRKAQDLRSVLLPSESAELTKYLIGTH